MLGNIFRRAALLSLLFPFAGRGHGQADPGPLRAGGKRPAPVLNIAHRGARAFAPENTLEAFSKAVRLAAHMVELDVHLSKDGVLIVVHDDTLERCSDVKAKFPERKSYYVSDFTAAELATLDAGSWFAAELSKPPEQRQEFLRSLTKQEIEDHISGEERARYSSGKVRHPTLAEALELAKKDKLLVNIEIKSLPRLYPDIGEKVVKLVETMDLERQVIVSSFDHVQLAAVRKLNKRIATGVLSSDRLHEPAKYVRDLEADAYNPGCYNGYDSLGFNSVSGQLDAAAIKSIVNSGPGVNAWTENDPARMKALIAAGVTGIFTDYPNRLKKVLEEQGR